MTSKTMKTVLFASLIAAMILPFSVMEIADAVPNENANDNAKDRFNYKVEPLSKTKTSEKYVDGVKITHFKQTVKQTDFPTVQDFKDLNAEYFAFLESEFGLEGKEMQKQLIADFKERIANAPEVYEIETTKIGNHSITFEPFTRDLPSTWGNQKDPINLIFYNNGARSTVGSLLDFSAPHSWHAASGGPQWTFVDETAHGGSTYWAFGYGYEEGTYTDRYHVRLFDGGVDTHSGGFGTWSLGAVHRENCSSGCHTHYSNSWETSENHIGGDFANTSGIGVVSSINLGNSGYYQGIYNNGYAAFIKVQ